jgi:asparagine synthase (glutamine-hydrolysing)
MCGIAGFISSRHPSGAREAALQRMLEALIHRGPDDSGQVCSGPATLGMRRLAVFDPAHGHQPMSSPDRRHHLVFNGAIYNFRQLRPAYAARGWHFQTECDTELLLAALSLDGPSALPRLRGMFAFAFWDADERSLLLGRDPLGIKPLYYHAAADGSLLFASECRALLASRQVPPDLDPAAAADFLRRLAIPAPRTLHLGIRALRPGEQLLLRDARPVVSAWWVPASIFPAPRPVETPPAAGSIPELRSQLRTQLEDSVRAHLAADVPVGAFLSGGLDSAVICALMARHAGPALKCFTLDFAERGFSEASEAAATARHLGIEHHLHTLDGASVAQNLDSFLASLDQPTGDGLNTHHISRFARHGGVTVALSGIGADELFGGYPSFRRLPALARLLPAWRSAPAPLRDALIGVLGSGPTRWRKLAATLRLAADGASPAMLALSQRSLFTDTTVAALLAPAGPAAAPAPHPATPELEAAWTALLSRSAKGIAARSHWAALAGLSELRGYMAELLLRDADEFSMRSSLELRTPFVDLPLLRWTATQDPALLHAPGATPKSHLAAACADLLPPALFTRPKRGFALPFARWMRGPLRPFLEETLGSASAARSGLFDTYLPGRLWRDFRDGGDDRAWSRLWSLAVLIHLANRP